MLVLRDAGFACRRDRELYSGYPVKLNAWMRPQLLRFRSELHDGARSASDRECQRILSRYVAWFGDGHLRVTRSPAGDGAGRQPTLNLRDPGELRRLAGTSGGRASDGPRDGRVRERMER